MGRPSERTTFGRARHAAGDGVGCVQVSVVDRGRLNRRNGTIGGCLSKRLVCAVLTVGPYLPENLHQPTKSSSYPSARLFLCNATVITGDAAAFFGDAVANFLRSAGDSLTMLCPVSSVGRVARDVAESLGEFWM